MLCDRNAHFRRCSCNDYYEIKIKVEKVTIGKKLIIVRNFPTLKDEKFVIVLNERRKES